ncbi:tetratricopeptide repeat protein [Ferrimonas balearica]|uniref:tetratricopeptide repeat protein n=1 Tax=Ferrimonas balearica TaxID=44012 RepID=UPI001C991033|nr:flagellar protein MotX [Ferrimonas balearica]MBY5992303.1 SEL1-like repeat protein [Ferrimonas balearica]
MKRTLLAAVMLLAPSALAQDIRAVELYSQDDLLAMIRANTHLIRVKRDECQLVQDIQARADVLKQPAYQMLWADMHLYGVCVRKSTELGFQYLNEAAEQGLPDALEQLGRYYLEGRFVVSDEARGLRLTQVAASLGHHRALLTLAEHYAQGQGSPLDYPEVYRWLHQAVFETEAERRQAQRLKEQLALQLPPSVREQAHRAALGR